MLLLSLRCTGIHPRSPLSPALRRLFHGTARRAIKSCGLASTTFQSKQKPDLFEEETVHGYGVKRYYPVKLGTVFNSRYQTLAKLGFGTSSTVWLCRDIKDSAYVTLKVCTSDERLSQERAISRHLKSVEGEHPGRERARIAIDDFELKHDARDYQCLAFAPLGMTSTTLRNKFPEKTLDKTLLQQTLLMTLLGLDFLHQAGVVHTDLSPNNLLLGATDTTVFEQMEQAEEQNVIAHKVLEDCTIYASHEMPLTYGAPVISDFGSARLGEPDHKHSGDVMPNYYRAPEIILGLDWDSKIDIWSTGVMIWDLFEGGRLFYAVKDGHLNDEQHLAEMVSLLGPPPKQLLERSSQSSRYWDADGNWIAATPIPEQSLESRERRLQGKEHELLVALARKILRWLPEERPSAQELFDDEFLTQPDNFANTVSAE